MKMREITETSWIITHAEDRKAVMVKTPTKMLWLDDKGSRVFDSKEDLCASLNISLSLSVSTKPKVVASKVFQIGAWPCKHEPVFNIETDPITTYTKTENSSIKYAAGYWAFQFTNGWSGSWCPKLGTLNEYNHIGPFTSKLEMQSAINQKTNQSGD